MSIRWKIIASITVLFLATGIGTWGLLYTYFTPRFKQTISEQQQAFLQSTATAIGEQIDNASGSLAVVARKVTPAMLADSDLSQKFLDSRYALGFTFNSGIFLFDRTGKLIAESPFIDGRRGMDFSYRQYFKDAVKLKKSIISEPYRSSRPPNNPSVMMAIPIINRNNEVVAVMGGAIDLLNHNSFLKKLFEIKVGRTGYLYLYNHQRIIILHPDKDRIMQQDVAPGKNILFDKALEGFEGSGETVNSRGRFFLSSFVNIPSTSWILASNYPSEEAYEPVMQFRSSFLIFAGGMLILSCLAIWGITTTITGNLERFSRFINGIDPMTTDEISYDVKGRDEVSVLAGAFNNLMGQLVLIRKTLEDLGLTDHLTGLPNRRSIEQEMPRYSSLAHREGAHLALFMLDVDFFKKINDTYGHDVGDLALKHLASVIKKELRPHDLFARFGGEEFILLALIYNDATAFELAERLRTTVASYPLLSDGAEISITISIGLAMKLSEESLDVVIKHADSALYSAKRSGRNRVCVYKSDV